MSQNKVAFPTSGEPGLNLLNSLNNANDSLARLFSGPSAPTATGLGLSSTAGVPWHDTANNLLKIRNQADTAWITLGTVDETNGLYSAALKTDTSLRQIVASGAWSVNEAITSVNAAQSISAASHLANFVATAACAFTLAQTSTLTNGGCAFAVLAQGGAVTLTPNAADAIVAGSTVQAAGATYTLAAGASAFVVTNGAGQWYVFCLSTPAAASLDVPVRQTVLSGPIVAATGASNFGGSTGSTAVTASGTLIATAANGFGPNGAVDVVGSITNPSWTGLSTNGTMYLFLNIGTNGTCTTCAYAVQPVYSFGYPFGYALTAGQFTFVTSAMQGYLATGSSAPQTNLVAVGEVTVAGGVVTAITWYALQGGYTGSWTSPLPGYETTVSNSDNLGLTSKDVVLEVQCLTAENGFSIGDIVVPFTAPAASYASPFSPAKRRNQTIFITGVGITTAFSVVSAVNGSCVQLTPANWAYRIRAKRSF